MVLLAGMLAMAVVAAAPALGQTEQEFGQEIDESGDIEASFEISQTGDNGSGCAPALQFGGTGNLQNAQGGLQDNSTADDIEAEGSGSATSPELPVECEQKVQQSAAASGKAAPAPPPPPKAAPAPPPPPKAEAPKMEMKKEEAKKEEKKELRKTGGGGSASLLGLGAGSLLVGGGILFRRIVR